MEHVSNGYLIVIPHVRASSCLFAMLRTRNLFLKPLSKSKSFSTTAMAPQKLRIGYVPEHFSTPLAFASNKYYLHADLIPFPTGTGALAASLKAPRNEDGSIDVAIGLTEGFVADLGKSKAEGKHAGYGFVGTYVESPLCVSAYQRHHMISMPLLEMARLESRALRSDMHEHTLGTLAYLRPSTSSGRSLLAPKGTKSIAWKT